MTKNLLLLLALGVLHNLQSFAQVPDCERTPYILSTHQVDRTESGTIEIDTSGLRKIALSGRGVTTNTDTSDLFFSGFSANIGMGYKGDSSDHYVLDLRSLERMPVEIPKLKAIPEMTVQPKDQSR